MVENCLECYTMVYYSVNYPYFSSFLFTACREICFEGVGVLLEVLLTGLEPSCELKDKNEI